MEILIIVVLTLSSVQTGFAWYKCLSRTHCSEYERPFLTPSISTVMTTLLLHMLLTFQSIPVGLLTFITILSILRGMYELDTAPLNLNGLSPTIINMTVGLTLLVMIPSVLIGTLHAI